MQDKKTVIKPPLNEAVRKEGERVGERPSNRRGQNRTRGSDSRYRGTYYDERQSDRRQRTSRGHDGGNRFDNRMRSGKGEVRREEDWSSITQRTIREKLSSIGYSFVTFITSHCVDKFGSSFFRVNTPGINDIFDPVLNNKADLTKFRDGLKCAPLDVSNYFLLLS
jgi:hypothetical protein